MTQSFIPVLILLGFAVVLGGGLLTLNWFLGTHRRNPGKLAPYESGVPMLDENRKRVNVKFYQIAMVFIVFDIEAAFLFPWAVIYRDAVRTPEGIAWFIFIEMFVFIALLAAGYAYIWKKRTLDWK